MPNDWHFVSKGNKTVQVLCLWALKDTEKSRNELNVLVALSVQQTIKAWSQWSYRDFKHPIELCAGWE